MSKAAMSADALAPQTTAANAAPLIDKQAMTDQIMRVKLARGLSWEAMGEALSMSPVWLASACLGMNSAPPERDSLRAFKALILPPPSFLPLSSFRRRPESTPAWMQVVERRLEQTAEEGGPGCQVDNAGDACRDNPWLSFPLARAWIM